MASRARVITTLAVSRAFYEAALAPFGIETAEIEGAVGFGPPGSVDFFVGEGEPAALHIAFAAPDRATVDAFTPRRSPRAAATTVRLVSDRSTTPTITAHTSSIRTVTTLRLSAITRRPSNNKADGLPGDDDTG